jgi:RNA polymerase sigma-32 factor
MANDTAKLSNSFDLYRSRIRRLPILDRASEQALARRWRDKGDREAADRLIESGLRFVVQVALRYLRYGVPLADLVAEGNVGLLEALRRFDPARGVRFMTYAAFWIEAYVRAYARRHQSVVLRSPWRPSRRPRRRDLSLDAPLFLDSEVTGVEALEAPGAGPEEQLAQAQREARLRRALARACTSLDARERAIVDERLRRGEERASLREMGRRLGISRERVRQIESRLKDKLRQAVERELEAA